MSGYMLSPAAVPVATLAAGVAVGIALDVLLARYVHRAHARGAQDLAAATARAMRGLPAILCGIVGAWLALSMAGIEAENRAAATMILKVVAIVAATVASSRLAGLVVDGWMTRDDTQLPPSTIFVNLARGAVFVAGGLVAVSAVGVSIAPMLTALGVGGLAVGLALQDTLGNLFTGIQILLSRQIEPGDMIRLESGEEGRVHDVTWRNTTIRLLTNDLLVVPNSKLGGSLVTNYTSLDAQHVVWVEVGVAYGSDLDHVETVTLDVAREVQREVPGAVPDYEPLMRFTSFGDSSVNLRVSVRGARFQDRWLLMHEAVKRLHKRYAAEGIEIPFPQRDVHLKSAPEA